MLVTKLYEEFLFDCQVRELSDKTINNYRKQLAMFLRFLASEYEVYELELLSPIHIKGYVSMLQKRKSKPSYINDLLKAVKCMMGYAYREGYTPELLTKRVSNVKEPKVLIHTFSDDEIRSMIGYYNNNDYLSIRNKLIIMLLFDTGIRVSEMLQMKPEQIQDNYILIHGKGRKERIVPKSPIISKWMLKYEAERDSYFMYRNAKDNYFLSKNGKPLTEEAVCKFLKNAAKAIGVDSMVRVSPHTFRHTFAHQQLKNGLDLYSLSRLLGHESVSITQRYLESIRDSQVLNAAKRTGVLNNIM